MAKKKRQPHPQLTDADVLAFQTVARLILRLEELNEDNDDWDGSTLLMNQLYSSLSRGEYEQFQQIIEDAGDPAFRNPQ